MKYIGLIDCNNFFVSCERLFRPDLKQQPVIVLSSNDGCVVSRSQEAKALNIPMGIPVFQIKDIIKDNDVAVFSSNFTLYRDISARVMSVLRSEIAKIEQYSIDESFFEIQPSINLKAQLMAIKDKIEQGTGIPVSIGVGGSKTQAKVAAARAKLGEGVFVWDEIWWRKERDTYPLSRVWGVGPRLSRRFASHGLTTVSGLLEALKPQVEQLFGVVGTRLQAELSGQQVYRVESKQTLQKSIMHSRSFAKTITEKEKVFAALIYHVNQALEELRAMDAVALGCSIYARASRFSDYAFQGVYQDITLDTPSADPQVFLPLVRDAFDNTFVAGVPYKKAGVTLFGITPSSTVSKPLFATFIDTTTLLAAVDGLNERYGTGTVSFFGSQADAVHSAKKYASPRYTTHWQDIPTVRAL